jgi:hypothetical protein
MDARELRIGNYFIGPNGIEQVLRLNSTMVNSYGEDEITGIPLNEEWLVKMGFNKIEGWGWEKLILKDGKEYPAISFYGNQWWLVPVEGPTTSHWIPADLKYVHQLQNLYFALTGEELTIK